jgi:FKBP-type peptidyl-prolyl cis-trans isomerase FklB
MDFSKVEDKVCYGIGIQIASQLKHSMFPAFSLEHVVAGIKDAFEGKLALSDAELSAAFEELNKNLAAEQAKLAEVAKAQSKKFLDENAKKDGVVVTASGLQYEVITEGTGNKPTESDSVSVHYHGTLVDGTVFDSSVERGQPATFGVTQVIKGWVEGLQLMNVGSKYRFFIPSGLAYGDHGAGSIPPGAALIFEVELLSIV